MKKNKNRTNSPQTLYNKAKKIIPGGTQLLSKRPEMFLPGLWPTYYSRAKGCEIWDIKGSKYIDTSFMGIGANILGYADNGTDKAVHRVVRNGNMTTLNCPEEVELAELLLKLHPWAGMVRYARTGGEAMAIAVRIARAHTNKEVILFCGYHGWHDWYISANISDKRSLDGHLLKGLNPQGIPRCLKNTSIPFKYNDTEGFLKLIRKYSNRTAAVVMEPIRNYYPSKDFLRSIRKTTKKHNIPLIFDEITSGWRLANGGAHKMLRINPDMAVFAKGMSNGYPMAAVIGRKSLMQSAQHTFISSTYWTERIGPTAAIETINKIISHKVPRHLTAIGRKVQMIWSKAALANDIKIEISGIYPLSHFEFVHKDALLLKTLFTQKMLDEGFLATTSFYASFAHKHKHIDKYEEATERTFSFISKAVKSRSIREQLKCRVCHSGFKRLN